jgi:uncharacterized protein YrrD
VVDEFHIGGHTVFQGDVFFYKGENLSAIDDFVIIYSGSHLLFLAIIKFGLRQHETSRPKSNEQLMQYNFAFPW